MMTSIVLYIEIDHYQDRQDYHIPTMNTTRCPISVMVTWSPSLHINIITLNPHSKMDQSAPPVMTSTNSVITTVIMKYHTNVSGVIISNYTFSLK